MRDVWEEVHGPVICELWPRTGPATGYTFFHPCPRHRPDLLSAAPCACPIGKGLFQYTILFIRLASLSSSHPAPTAGYLVEIRYTCYHIIR